MFDKCERYFQLSMVLCSLFRMLKKALLEEDALACEDHGTSIEPKYKYYVNAKIADETSSTNVVFFNEGMTNAQNIPCSDMVIKHGHINPKVVLPTVLSIKGIPKIMHINLKADGTMAVNRVFNARDPHHLKDRVLVALSQGNLLNHEG